VPLVDPLPAVLAGIVLFFVPGLVFLALLGEEDRRAVPLDEALFLTVAVSVSVSAWVGLVLAEAGWFSLTTAALLLAAAGGLILLAGWRRLHGPWPRPGALREVVPAFVVLGLALALEARPSEYLMGGRDPGTYIAAMGVIGRTGGIAYTDPGVLSIPPEDRELFYRSPGPWGRFMGFPLERPETGRVVPHGFHLFPAFGAYLFQSMGAKGALATPCVFGVLGTLAVFFAWRRVFGPAPALLAAVLLSLNVVQVWFARYPLSETVSQFLLFLALLAFAHWEERGSTAFGALAGFALGLSLLVRIDSVLIAVPLGAYVLVRRAHGELPWAALRPVALPLLLLAGHTGVHALFWSRTYVLDIAERPYWNQPAHVWLLGTLAVMALILIAHRLEPRVVAWTDSHGSTVRGVAMAVVAGLALYAYFLRPALSAWAGADGNAAGEALADPGLLRALGFRLLAAHDAQAFLRLGWFVTPLGLILGVAGLLVAIREWRPRYLFPVLLAATFAGFYFYKIRVHNDYFFALRRYVPVVLPALLGFAALAIHRVARAGGARRVAAGALALFLGGAYLKDTLPLVPYRDWRDGVRFVADMARHFGPEDVVIFEQPRSIHLLSLPLWALHGVNVLELARFDPDPVRLQHLVESWRKRYRNVYFVHTYSTDLCGLFLERVQQRTFGTYEWERAWGRKPRGPEPRAFTFRISRVVPPEELQVPPLPEVDIGGTDDVQVSGFFDKEGYGDRTYRWTGGCASVYLPGARGARSIAITASKGRRPSPAPVKVSLGGVVLGTFEAGPDWTDRVLPLPAAIPGPPILRLDVKAWRPANVLPGSTDERDLGIMVDRIRMTDSSPPGGAP